MELLSDSEADVLRWIRKRFTEIGNQTIVEILAVDMQFLLRYIGELENELWSRDHG